MSKKEEIRAIHFHCKECEVPVSMEYAIWHNNDLVLIGTCGECGEGVSFSGDSLSAHLIQANMPQQNSRVH